MSVLDDERRVDERAVATDLEGDRNALVHKELRSGELTMEPTRRQFMQMAAAVGLGAPAALVLKTD
jgi:hypothetical protein